MEESFVELIGHVQSSRGLSLSSFLAACVDVVSRTEGDEPSIIVAAMQVYLSSLLDLDTTKIMSFSPCRKNPVSALYLNEDICEDSLITYKEFREILLQARARSSSSGSEWLLNMCADMFDCIVKIRSNVSGLPSSETKILKADLIYVLGSLFSLEKLGIRQLVCVGPISFNPLSMDETDDVAVLRELLVGFPLNTVVSDNVEPQNVMVVSLLRVLSDMDKLPNNRPSPITLKASGLGHSSQSSDVVSILVGSSEDSMTTVSATIKTTSELSTPWLSDTVTQLECNLDDITGELLAHVIELLLKEGAADAWVTPIVMKKGRPAHTLHCLCLADKPKREEKLLETMFRHTTTLGVRIYRNLPRAKLCRSLEVAQTPYTATQRKGRVNVKVSSFRHGEVLSMKPEFDHCQEISRESGIPLKIVAESALSDTRRYLQQKKATSASNEDAP
jgi:hypothetical protein